MNTSVPDVNFISNSILHTRQFSWVFLCDCAMIAALTILSLFYFNQILGVVISYTYGWYLYKRYKIYFKVQSVKFSLVSCRVMFANVVYIDTSHAVRIVNGSLTWQYWLPMRRQSAFLGGANKDAPAALLLKMFGVEAFVFNNEAAYDALRPEAAETTDDVSTESVSSSSSSGSSAGSTAKLAESKDPGPPPPPSYLQQKFFKVLPLAIQIRRLGIVVGNDDTDSLLIVSAPRGRVEFDCFHDREAKEPFVRKLRVRLTQPKFDIRDNVDFQASSLDIKERAPSSGLFSRWRERWHKKPPETPWYGLGVYAPEYEQDSAQNGASDEDAGDIPLEPLASASTVRSSASSASTTSRLSFVSRVSGFSRTIKRLRSRSISIPDLPQNPKEGDGDASFATVASVKETDAYQAEYAKVTQIAACDSLELTAVCENVKVAATNAKLAYGPWAERKRQSLMAAFFPRSTQPQKPWSLRVAVNLTGESALVVPVREISKDETIRARDVARNYGWFELRTSTDTGVSVDVYPTSLGSELAVSVLLADVEVRSSVNHETFMTAQNHTVSVVMKQPRVFNAQHDIVTTLESRNLDIFLLREHNTLISDAMTDFAEGLDAPYTMFTPMLYSLKWKAHELALYVNVNKGNIINNPTSTEENTFIKFVTPVALLTNESPRLEIAAPFAHTSTIFHIPDLRAELNAPNWHTLNAFLDTRQLARVTDFKINFKKFISLGKHSDRSIIDIAGTDLQLLAHGATIAYFYRIMENYFGEFRSFQTTAEFNAHDWERAPPAGDFSRHTNEEDIILTVHVHETVWKIPTQLYRTSSGISLECAEIIIDTRFTNFYMDLQASISPIVLRYVTGEHTGDPCITIHGIDAHAHRMFGLPPLEPTYLVRWNIEMGNVTGKVDSESMILIARSVRALKHACNDDENRPILGASIVSDVAFFTVNIGKLDLALETAELEIMLTTEDTRVFFSDLPTDGYAARVNYSIPEIVVRVHTKAREMIAFLETSVSGSEFGNPRNWREHAVRRRQFLARHDALFHRAACLLDPDTRSRYPYTRARRANDVVNQRPLPQFPYPLRPGYRNRTGSTGSASLSVSDAYSSTRSPPSVSIPKFEDSDDASCTTAEFEALSIDLQPQFFSYLDSLMASFSPDADADASALLDDLQEWVVDENKALTLSIVRRIHLHFPLITVRLNSIVLELNHLHIMLGLQENRTSYKFGIDSIEFSIETYADELAFYFEMRKIDLSWQHTGEAEGVGSMAVGDIECTLAASKVDFIVDEASRLVQAILDANTRRDSGSSSVPDVKPSKDNMLQALVVALTDASDELSVEQDTYVLSRPSGGVQSPSHIRATLNWRVVMRLRFLLQRLPEWKFNEIAQNIRHPEVDDSALQHVLNAFKRWRSWEHSDSDVLDATIFKHIFVEENFVELLASMKVYLSASVGAFVVRIKGAQSDSLSLLFEGCHADLDAMKTIGVTVRFTRCLAHGDLELVNFMTDMLYLIDQRFPQTEERPLKDSLKRRASEGVPRPMNKNVRLIINRLHNATFSVFVLDISIQHSLGAVKVETQNHQVQFTALFERNPETLSIAHTGTLATSTGAFRIFTPEGVDVMDSLLRSVHLGYTHRLYPDPKSHDFGNGKSSLFASLKIQSASMASHLEATNLAELVLRFLKDTVPLLKAASEKIPERFMAPDGPEKEVYRVQTAEGKGDVKSGHFVNVEIDSLKLKARLVDDLNLLLQGKSFTGKIRHSGFMIGSFDLTTSSVSVKHGDNGTLGSVQLDQIRALLRSIPSNRDSLLFSRVNSVKLETMSVVWLLEYTLRRKVDQKFVRFMSVLGECIELIRASPTPRQRPRSQLAVEPVTPPSMLRIVNHTHVVSALLPIDSSSIEVRIDTFSVDFQGRDAETRIESFKVLLKSPRHRIPREIISLQAGFSLSQNPQTNLDVVDVESKYMKLAIDPDSMIALAAASEKISHMKTLAKGSSRRSSISGLMNLASETSRAGSGESLFSVSELKKLRLYFKLCLFSFTYYTSSSSQEGIVIGFKQLEIRLLDLLGEIKLSAMFAKPVNNICFSASLPLIEAQFCVSEEQKRPSFDFNVSGRSFLLTLTPSSARWMIALYKSVEQARDALRPAGLQRSTSSASMKDTISQTLGDARKGKFSVPFDIGFVMKFDGGTIKVNDENSHNAMHLMSPTVDVAAEIAHERVVVRIDLSTTKNEVFPKAVGEIKQFITAFRAYTTSTASSPTPSLTATATQLLPAKVEPVLSAPDSEPAVANSPARPHSLKFDVRIHFGTQELYLSCAPYGKVGALLSTGGFDVIVSGGSRNSVIAKLREVKISLQHIHSREISAMLAVNRITLVTLFRSGQPLQIGMNVASPRITAHLGKIHEMRMFFDIWNVYDPVQDEVIPSASSSVAKAGNAPPPVCCLVNFDVTDLEINLGLGPSIGDAKLVVTKAWAILFKDGAGGVTLNSKTAKIEASFEGRLGGLITLENVEATLAKSSDGLHHHSLHVDFFGAYLSLDFHAFLTFSVRAFYLVLTTQDVHAVGDERLHVAAKCQAMNIALTELVGIHILEITTLFKRLQKQIASAASFIASRDTASRDMADAKERKLAKRRQQQSSSSIASRVVLDLRLGELIVHAFPTDLGNTSALKLYIARAEIHYDEIKKQETLKGSLDLGLDECLVCMVHIKNNPYTGTGTAAERAAFDYLAYLSFMLHTSSGGTIVNLPELALSMDTVEPLISKHGPIKYTFSNQFHGSIEVGWNLGSVSFIKEMLKTHKDALKNHNSAVVGFDDDEPISPISGNGTSGFSDAASELIIERVDTKDSSASTDSSFIGVSDPNVMFGRRYEATSPPVIMIPQLRDLGDATPPIEWLGLNRDRLPLFVHAMIMHKLHTLADALDKV